MRIGEIADRTGVTAKTLRFYERRGLVPDPGRTASGYRDYRADAVERVTFIRQTQGAGFTLAQIGEILAIRDGGRPPCDHVATLVHQRLDVVERRLLELQELRSRLLAVAERANEYDLDACDGYCGLISDL